MFIHAALNTLLFYLLFASISPKWRLSCLSVLCQKEQISVKPGQTTESKDYVKCPWELISTT